MAVNNAVRMALCIECSPAVQEVPGSIPDCDALIASRSGPSLLSSGCSPTLYAEDVGGPLSVAKISTKQKPHPSHPVSPASTFFMLFC